MKLQFDASMEEASIMFVAEHKAWDIVRRLKEQNEYIRLFPTFIHLCAS